MCAQRRRSSNQDADGRGFTVYVTAIRPLDPLRMASITRESEKAAAYPERCRSNFDSSMLPETSAARTRRRSTRSAARLEVQPAIAISAASTKVRTTRITLEPCSSAANSWGRCPYLANRIKPQWPSYGSSRFASLLSNAQNDLNHSSENSDFRRRALCAEAPMDAMTLMIAAAIAMGFLKTDGLEPPRVLMVFCLPLFYHSAMA
jgi:hypothetical protein